MNIHEKYLLNSINFTETQKSVLIKIYNSTSAKLAADELTKDRKFIVARNILNKLGIIQYNSKTDSIILTNKGKRALLDSGLIDESGTITDIGQKYLNVGSASPKNKNDINQAFESYELFLEIHNFAKFN